MYPHQSERLTGALEREALDALVATTPENVEYVTGFRSPSRAASRGAEVYAVFTRRGTALVVPAADVATVAAEGAEVDQVRCYGRPGLADGAGADTTAARIREWTREPAATAAAALAAALDALGARAGRVGVDESGLSPVGWRRLDERLGAGALVEAAGPLALARSVKSPWEIETLERVLGITEEALDAVVQMLRPGITEREAADLFEREVRTRGARPSRAVVLAGARSAFPAATPSDRGVRTGELIRLDVGAVLKGYRSDVARTAVVGRATAEQAARHEASAGAVAAAIDALRPGTAASRAFEAAIAAARDAGLAGYDRDEVGHGLGLELREPPLLAPGDATPLEMAMVLTVEAPCYEPGWGGVQARDTVVVTRAGARVLNRSVRALVELD